MAHHLCVASFSSTLQTNEIQNNEETINNYNNQCHTHTHACTTLFSDHSPGELVVIFTFSSCCSRKDPLVLAPGFIDPITRPITHTNRMELESIHLTQRNHPLPRPF